MNQPIIHKSLAGLYEAIITASAAARPLAIEEIEDFYLAGVPLSETVLLASLSASFAELAEFLQANPPIFIQHICPPQAQIPLALQPADLDQLAAAARILEQTLPRPGGPFSVQTRLADNTYDLYRPFQINERLAGLFIEKGWALDVRNPFRILSVVIAANTAYLGLSTASQNLSNWAGGQQRFKRSDDQISRSEFKLLEAISVFNLELTGGGKALDLGAAPGGWTRILRQHGYQVYAVDPARLHPQLEQDPNVSHFREPAQRFLTRKLSFDLIANDMRLDAAESASLMVAAAPKLAPQGLAIMTLKLPLHQMRQRLNDALEILKKAYHIRGVRQLFHNRNEVTAVLQKKR